MTDALSGQGMECCREVSCALLLAVDCDCLRLESLVRVSEMEAFVGMENPPEAVD